MAENGRAVIRQIRQLIITAASAPALIHAAFIFPLVTAAHSPAVAHAAALIVTALAVAAFVSGLLQCLERFTDCLLGLVHFLDNFLVVVFLEF